MLTFSSYQWFLAVVAALGVGIGKGGLSGVGLVSVVLFAFLFGARESTGVVLPMLLVGDLCALTLLHQHVRWDYVRRMLPPACIGILIGVGLMGIVSEAAFRPLIGWIILVLSIFQFARMQRPNWFGDVPHNRWFAWAMGLAAGITSMLANAAGPIYTLYALAVSLPKFEIVGTSAWLFLFINGFKLPFSIGLGLVTIPTLLFNAAMTPIVIFGVFGGRWLITRLPQRFFDALLLLFAAVAALRLIGVF